MNIEDDHEECRSELARCLREKDTLVNLLRKEIEILHMTELPVGWMAAPQADWNAKDTEIARLRRELGDTEQNKCEAEMQLDQAREHAANLQEGGNILSRALASHEEMVVKLRRLADEHRDCSSGECSGAAEMTEILDAFKDPANG